MVNYKRVVCVLAVVATVTVAAPAPDCREAHYDQRQNGTENYRLNIDGVVIAVAPADSLLSAASDIDFSDLFDLEQLTDYQRPKPPSELNKPEKPEKPIEPKPQEVKPQESKPESSAEPAAPAKPDIAPLSEVNLNDDVQSQKKEAPTRKQEKAQSVELGKSGAGDYYAQSPANLRARIMLLLLACVIAAARAAPATYDQRQDGEFNVRADVQNVVLLVAIPQKSLPTNFFDGLVKNAKPQAQERADVHVMEAFVEPSTPYHVEIGGGSNQFEDVDGRTVEVVIAGRRRMESEAEESEDRDELKLIGATEQCGPDQERDPVSLICRAISQPTPEYTGPATHPDNKLDSPAKQKEPEVITVL